MTVLLSPDTVRIALKLDFAADQATASETESALAAMNRWLARGDGIAVYRNVAFDSSQLGRRKFVSYGSVHAQIELGGRCDKCGAYEKLTDMLQGQACSRAVCQGVLVPEDPPTRLPDIGSDIDWPYQLEGVYYGAPLDTHAAAEA